MRGPGDLGLREFKYIGTYYIIILEGIYITINNIFVSSGYI